MKFIIHQVKIWFKKGQRHRVLDFKQNKINVVTGDSGTGKTNILAIIDYCLLSEKNNIVQQVINENAEWYSLKLTINHKCYFIARKKELLGQDSSAVCFLDNGEEPIYPKENKNINTLRKELNSILGIINTTPYKELKGDSFKVSYRTNLVFNYLTERIIALDNVYFDFDFFIKSIYSEHERDILESAIGFDYTRLIKLQQELKNINDQKDSYNKWKNNEIGYEQSIVKLFNRALQYNLVEDADLFDNFETYPDILYKMVGNYKRVSDVEKKSIDDLSSYEKELSSLKLEMQNINRIEKEYQIADRNIAKLKDVLSPIEIIGKHKADIVRSFETEQLIAALKLSLQQLKETNAKKSLSKIIPQIEKDKINGRIKELQIKIEKYKPKDILIKNKAGFAFVEAMEIGKELDALLNNRNKLSKKGQNGKVGNFAQQIIDINEKIKMEEVSKFTLLNSFNNSMQSFYNCLSSMGIYSNYEVNFDIENLVVKIKEIGSEYPLEKIGSKSNDMFLHLCCFLGIHKIAFDMKNKQKILPFLFIDQPSIPYYSGSDVNNDDKDKLVDAFKLLDDFISLVNKEYNDEFQIIMIEHAPESYWKDAKLSNFHTVDIFTDGNKLIPNEIIQNN